MLRVQRKADEFILGGGMAHDDRRNYIPFCEPTDRKSRSAGRTVTAKMRNRANAVHPKAVNDVTIAVELTSVICR